MNTENGLSEQLGEIKTPRMIAKGNEISIKGAIEARFGVLPEELVLLLDDEGGVYFSKEEPNILCCLVVDKDRGFLYLVTGEMKAEDGILKNIKCDILG